MIERHSLRFAISSATLAAKARSVVTLAVLGCASSFGMACGDDDARTGFGEDGGNPTASSSSGSTEPTGPIGSFGDASAPPPGATDDCPEAAKLVYVLSRENDLYSFKPNTKTFTKIGRLSCPSANAGPNSMAVDRKGVAWINYSNGGIFKASTTDASCTASGYTPGQSGFTNFGMAFAANAAGSSDETLFVSDITPFGTSKGLAKIDTATLKLTTIGSFSGNLAGKPSELTGTGDGKLYGFFTTSPAAVALIDKATAATSDQKSLTGVKTGTAWAFSFWGGDFWFYTAQGASASKVTRLKTSANGEIETAMEDVGGFGIVGAGVSTCAPTTPPSVN